MLLAEHFQASVHHLRIVKYPARMGNLLQRNFQSQARTIWAMRGYRLNHVGHAKNACFKKNLIAFESLWIARTIHAFMVLQHDFCDWPWEVDGFKYFVAALGMFLDDAKFQYGELSRLAENFGRNSNLANIVH